MGNSQSPQDMTQCLLTQCLLTHNQFKQLRVNGFIDHRNHNGKFVAAQVLFTFKARNAHQITLRYDSRHQNDVTVGFKYGDFAIHQSISTKKASGTLSDKGLDDIIAFKPDANSKWTNAQIIKMDVSRKSKVISGQVFVQYKSSQGQLVKRWTHLDNQHEVQEFGYTPPTPKQQQQRGRYNHNNINTNNRPNNNRPNNNGYNNNNNNGVYNQQNTFSNQYGNYNHNGNNNNNYQSYQQAQEQRQDEVTVVTQLLLDDTNHQIQLTKDYLKAVSNTNLYTKNEIRRFNQKVVVGLQCFQMKVDGMRENAEKENINFTDAFKSSAQIIRQFEQEFKSQFGNNKYIMQRLNPCLNYMRCVLQGKSVPQLPYINNYKFDKQTASNVISQFNHATNHVIPDRMNQVNNNKKYYKDEQNKLKEKYDKGGNQENVTEMDFNGLIQDYNTKNIAFGKTKAQQDKIMKQQEIEQNARDLDDELLNGGGNDSDIAAMSEDEQ